MKFKIRPYKKLDLKKIEYGVAASPFGFCFVAFFDQGLLSLAFADGPKQQKDELTQLRNKFPNASFEKNEAKAIQLVKRVFKNNKKFLENLDLNLWVTGTEFQLKVWKALLTIKPGKTSCYSEIAAKINHPRATRAVGTAVGSNPISFLIPCHRVLQKSGNIGQYHWGVNKKTSLLRWEASL